MNFFRNHLYHGIAMVLTIGIGHSELVWHSPLDGRINAIVGNEARERGPGASPGSDIDLNPEATLVFNGNDNVDGTSYVIAPDSQSFSAGSLSIWIRPDIANITGEDGFIALGGSGGGSAQYFTMQIREPDTTTNTARIRLDLDDGGGGSPRVGRQDVFSDAGVVTGDTWHHIAATFDSSIGGSNELRLYINGVLQMDVQAIPALADGLTMSNDWVVGAERFNDRYFFGGLDDARFFNNELSAAEVQALFTAGPLLAPDSDGDDLPDYYEIRVGLNEQSSAPPNGRNDDADSDNLTNFQEFELFLNARVDDGDEDGVLDGDEISAGTNPRDNDTDGDGLLDGIESNSGTFVDLNTDTGTNPLLRDTDHDGFDDNVETNTRLFVDETNTGTDPNERDTDQGGVGDRTEVDLGNDPFQASDDSSLDIPNILFVGGNSAGNAGADDEILAYLIATFGFDGVTYIGAPDLTARTESTPPGGPSPDPSPGDGRDLVLISSNVGSGDVRGQFQDTSAAIINWEPAIADIDGGDLQLTFDFPRIQETLTDGSTATFETTDLTLTASDHPITDVFEPGSLSIFTQPQQIFASRSTDLALGAITLGTNESNLSNGPVSSFFLVETGGDLNGIDPVGSPGLQPSTAPGHRIELPFSGASFNLLTEDGLLLFRRTLDWALGRELTAPANPSSDPIVITNTSVNSSTDMLILSWISVNGSAYDIEINTSNNLAADQWIKVTTNPIVASSQLTTADLSIDILSQPRAFFRITETGLTPGP